MTATQFFVATDEFGVERMSGKPVQWTLPKGDGPSIALARPDDELVVLRSPLALLDTLDEVIWVAEPIDSAIAVDDSGELHVHAARLITRTSWNPSIAARFAIECAEHAIGDAADVTLPNGQRIADVLVDARAFLDSASESSAHLGLLSRLATIRRLKRENRLVTDLAYGLSIEDLNNDLDVTLDPAWTSAASVADSLFAALEALRHLAFPRYVRAREALAVEQETHGDTSVAPTILSTPWGSVTVGGSEHESPYLPSAVAAREAALRAREAVRDREGTVGEAVERRWQADRLAASLGVPAGI
ncbi:MAG TPA: hypothetical protein VG368_05730 [Acidimicrobiales bacterium]|nr:hypothetical protein [Acidimicrobiales bacterium]